MNGGGVVRKEGWILDVHGSCRSLSKRPTWSALPPDIKRSCILRCIVSNLVNNTSQDTRACGSAVFNTRKIHYSSSSC
jgi:hypothetical protein